MPKKGKMGPTRHDKYYHLAKEQGYRARSAFKLIQLNKKYGFLEKSRSLMDLCAAPGGWMQVAVKYMPVGSLIVGVDLLPIKPIRGCISGQQDITTVECRTWLKQQCQGWKLDTVIHDGAPNVGGNSWLKDAYMQLELCLHSLKLATEFLAPGGTFITKVFRAKDYNAFLWVCKKFFKRTEVTKPPSSRNTSAEIYICCFGYLNPKKIDPRLLDPLHVFQETDTGVEEKKVDVFHQKPNARHRSGYADGVTILFSKASVSNFIDSKDPIPMLGDFNKFEWDEESSIYEKHAATTEEIKLLIDDLKVLGKNDFKQLLKWREKLRAFKKSILEAGSESEGSESESEEELTPEQQKELEEKKLTEQLDELKEKALVEKRSEQRKRRERKRKLRERAELNLNTPNIQEGHDQQGLFALANIKDNGELEEIQQAGSSEDELIPEDYQDDIVVSGPESEEEGSASDGGDYNRKLEAEMDAMYSAYKARRKLLTKKERQKMLGVGFDENDKDEDELLALAARIEAEKRLEPESDSDGEGNPLVVDIGDKFEEGAKTKAKRFFSRDLFGDVEGELADSESEEDDSRSKSKKTDKKKKSRNEKRKIQQSLSDVEDSSDEEDDNNNNQMDVEEEEDETMPSSNGRISLPPKRDAQGKMILYDTDSDDKSSDDDEDSDGGRTEKDGFDVVPLQNDSDFSDDSDARAEILAIGTQMIRKDRRQKLIDDSFNRYSYGDEKDLPEWFIQNELAHNKKILPITKDEVDMFKAELMRINARPMKKVAEAKGRKKVRALKKWEQMKTQAQSIVDNGTLSQSDKIKSIEKLYKGREKKRLKVERTYVVASKAGGQKQSQARKNVKGPVKIVDKRLKNDKRAERRSAKKKKKTQTNKNKKRHGQN